MKEGNGNGSSNNSSSSSNTTNNSSSNSNNTNTNTNSGSSSNMSNTAAISGCSVSTTAATATPTAAQASTATTVTVPQSLQQQQLTPRKSNIHELRNQDYVSRLMAATPPYLYSAPVGPNNYFFSDMLRSLVQARNNETARVLQLQQQQQQQQQQQHQQQQAALVRRSRKRSWSHRPYYEQLRERRDAEEKQQQQQQQQLQQQQHTTNIATTNPEKPLELTNKTTITPTSTSTPYTYAKLETKALTKSTLGGAVDTALQDNTPPAASLPPQDLVLPPPPPVWYPPLYAPYGIDPLHFFIDLRVSGHIYDRKKENVSPLSNSNGSSTVAGTYLGSEDTGTIVTGTTTGSLASNNLLSKQRHGSAFTVPIPKSAQNDAINLCANGNNISPTVGGNNAGPVAAGVTALGKFEHYAKYCDLGESKENQPAASTATQAAAAAAAAAANLSKSGASYMLQHLPRLYSQFAAQQEAAAAAAVCDMDTKSESASACADLCDDDSLGRGSTDTTTAALLEANSLQNDREIDVEIIDSIKYRTDGESSRCSSNDEASVTQIE